MFYVTKCLFFPFLTVEQQVAFFFCQNHDAVFMENHNWSIFAAFWKQSMINQLANLINRNRSVVKIYMMVHSFLSKFNTNML